jgi:hypothetical protein
VCGKYRAKYELRRDLDRLVADYYICGIHLFFFKKRGYFVSLMGTHWCDEWVIQ